MPAHAPTHALRLKVATRAAMSAGRTRSGQVRSRGQNRTRAAATQATSISWPEYVMYIPSAPCGRCPVSFHFRTPNWTIPIAALSAAMLMMTSMATNARSPRNSR
jgi:hypothetical protein